MAPAARAARDSTLTDETVVGACGEFWNWNNIYNNHAATYVNIHL